MDQARQDLKDHTEGKLRKKRWHMGMGIKPQKVAQQ